MASKPGIESIPAPRGIQRSSCHDPEYRAIAHHLFGEDRVRKIMIASLGYLDTFTKIGDAWYFAERNLILDWSETRFLNAPAAN
jgi:hypothetical protein